MPALEQGGVQLFDVEGAEILQSLLAEPVLHSGQAHPVVTERGRPHLRRHGHEPTVDPLGDRLWIGRDVGALVHRGQCDREGVLRSLAGPKAALGPLPAPTGGRVATAVQDVGPGPPPLVNVAAHLGDVGKA